MDKPTVHHHLRGRTTNVLSRAPGTPHRDRPLNQRRPRRQRPLLSLRIPSPGAAARDPNAQTRVSCSRVSVTAVRVRCRNCGGKQGLVARARAD